MMVWLHDLVWIGNTLYPRWLVLIVLVMCGATITAVVNYVLRISTDG